jgi:hypothetical protein
MLPPPAFSGDYFMSSALGWAGAGDIELNARRPASRAVAGLCAWWVAFASAGEAMATARAIATTVLFITISPSC